MLTEAQQRVTQRCAARIKEAISKNGDIGFDEYMQLALHDTEVGYYCQQEEIFGKDGDFTTVPETSVHLAFCLAHACAKLIRDDAQRSILEIGAGSGKFACDILKYLRAWSMLPNRYYIYEPSAVLRAKQRELLEQEVPEYIERVAWLEHFDDKIETVIIIANEVLDALPVNCFEVQAQTIQERCVTQNSEGELSWGLRTPQSKFDAALDFITVMLDEPLTEGYQSEINLQIEPTLASWAESCEQCVMFLIDYGYPCNEYYHPQRNMGTLRSYYKHQVSEDVFTNPGLQDITADVDFSAVAKVAAYLGMGVLSFSSQRNFMLANNLLDWRPSADNEVEHLAQIAQLKQLTLGSAISERFQVMVLGKCIEYGVDRFTMRDMRARL
jgi:SAM-dependent MidA family methyltransferase